MARHTPIMIPPGDPEGMRKQISQELNRVGTKLAQSDRRSSPMDLGHNRITSVADPGNPTDAVNLRTLKKALQDLPFQHVVRRPNTGSGLYSIVFSSIGAVVANQLSAPYIIMQNRSGTPAQVKVACSGTGTGSGVVNVSWNGTNILSTPITVPAGTKGPYTSTAFISNLTGFAENDIILPVISTAGGMSYVTIEIEVQP